MTILGQNGRTGFATGTKINEVSIFQTAQKLIYFHVFNVQEIADLWTNERLLNVVEQFIGPEIAGHPVWNIRIPGGWVNNALTLAVLIGLKFNLMF